MQKLIKLGKRICTTGRPGGEREIRHSLFSLKNMLLWGLGIALLLPMGCETEIDLNAPAKDIWVVYGVLNQDSSSQDIRIMRAFLPESDAIEFARENDLSVKGLQVTLTGGGITYTATQVDSVPTEPSNGVFYPYTTLYRFETSGLNALKPGERYNLEIRRPDSPEFVLRSYTYIPQEVRFLTPSTISGLGQSLCLTQAALEREYKVEFLKRSGSSNTGVGLGYEVRCFLDYTEQGVKKQASFGPTALFTTSQRCNSTNSVLCYQFRERDIINTFLNQMKPGALSAYTYGVTSATECQATFDALPRDFRFEVTAVDTFLTNYLAINSPAFQDFNTVRPEYTNITGTVTAYGLLGSINSQYAPAKLSPCSEYLLYLNGRPQPPSNCAR
jgi:hypothetical protein